MRDEPTNENLDDKMRDVPTDPPEVVPAPRIEQPALGAATGVAAFTKPTPATDNDEDSHVRPTDNDGETVPS